MANILVICGRYFMVGSFGSIIRQKWSDDGRPKSRRVELSEEDREFVLGVARTGTHPAQEVRRGCAGHDR